MKKKRIIEDCLSKIDSKRNVIIAKFQSNDLFKKYEFYSNNIETINKINNKSYIELNNELYYDILKNFNKINPDYLDSESNLIKDKNSLFNLSKDIVNVINSQIKDINEYIHSYTIKYTYKNDYFLDYNLYYFRKYFLDDFLNSLYNDFKSIIGEALKVQFIKKIDNNYALAFEYLNEVQSLIRITPIYRLLGTIFINTYSNYKLSFKAFVDLPLSSEFLNFIEENFFNVSNYVLTYINNIKDTI